MKTEAKVVVIGGGVPGEDETGRTAVKLISHCRHSMVGRQHRELAAIQINRLAQLDSFVLEEGFFFGGNGGEIRPHTPVEDMLFERIKRLFNRIDRYWAVTHRTHRINQKRN